MSDDPLLPHVRALLAERIESVAQLELLLFMYSRRGLALQPGDAAGELRISADWTRSQLDVLTDRGLLARRGEGYAYFPAPGLDEAVRDLAQAYRNFSVTVVRAIYSRQDQGLMRFADAFRLRRPPDGPQQEAPRG